jgi:hypothetical protein
MMLAEISASFLTFIRKNESSSLRSRSRTHEPALLLLAEYFSTNIALSEITPASLRDFLGRWYVEKACSSRRYDVGSDAPECDIVPGPRELLDALAQFFKWADQQAGTDLAERSSPVLLELIRSLPRAMEIGDVLSSWIRERGGAFGFPEFLTSFEEGGHSEYDIDTPGSVGALEGYFRILRVEGSSVEAEELISEERVWPIIFPPVVAPLMDDQYIINLELVRSPAGWQIAGCGFAYPPGTDV